MMGNPELRYGVFPGRFQPFTQAHLDRVLAICHEHPRLLLTICVGDVGCLNRENFLTIHERLDMIRRLFRTRQIDRVNAVAVPATTPARWARLVLAAVPEAEVVFSDNPFAYVPLQQAGLQVVAHQRQGVDAALLRNLPFPAWAPLLPDEVYFFLAERRLYLRLQHLPSSGRYPFLRAPENGL